ncbi:hypothetical protein ACOZ4I_17375 (plasmid) [Haloarcula salina]|uniref:hypothetical protein n=1 Tax=Haloarcula salina TaxID=1429914 RepID=UPI003C6EBAB2
MSTLDWHRLVDDTRAYLATVGDFDEDDPVPVDEFVATAEANGYDEREVREAVRNTDALEAVGGLDDLRVRLVDEKGDSADSGEKKPEEGGFPDATPTPEGDETGPQIDEATPPTVGGWTEADFTSPEPGVWAPEQIKRDAWMGRQADGGKAPFAPWADADAPVECSKSEHDEATTCAECSHHAGYKWGSDGSREHVHTDHATARDWAEKDPTLSSDLVFIQRDSDPFAFVDGDDVRDPETGEIHPAFEAILEHLGVTYADISTSGSGVHAVYRGEIPLDGVPQAAFDIDTEPFGANDDAPAVEIYANKHVCIATGDHVADSGTEIAEWDSDALRAVLQANGFDDKPEPSASSDLDLGDHDPTATTADETTDDIKDVFYAINRLDARRVAADTIVHSWNDSANTSDDHKAFAPTWGPNANGTANIVNDERWVDTGGSGYGGVEVMAAIDCSDLPSYDERTQPTDLSGADWFRAVDHLRDLGYSIPELEDDTTDESEEHTESARNLLEVDVVVEPANALAAAGAVEPEDLDEPLPELERDDVDDVAIAVALAEGRIDSPDQFPGDGGYTEAYYRARDHYGAPLPKYLDNTTLEERDDLVFAALERVGPQHILGSTRSDVTVEDPAGVAFAKLDPTWEDSESGERILAGYGRGFYCVEHDVSFSPIQLVALEHGLIASETDYPTGEAFKQAYRLLREEYGAPLPKWRATLLEHVAILPPAVSVLGESSAAPSLEETYEKTEALIRDAVGVRDRAQLVTVVPGAGKTYSVIKQADDTPILYTAGRNELKEQAEEYAAETGVSARHLPIFAEEQFDDVVLTQAVGAVYDDDRNLLRDRAALLDRVDIPEDDDGDDEDTADLERASCETADGEHGEEWAIAAQTARALGHTPAEIHTHDEALFGEELPCQHEGDCPYTLGWDTVRNPDSADVLIGAPGHAYVDSATTYFEQDAGGERVERSRAVVLDEFPGDEYVDEYGDRYLDHATWLANALVGVDTREDLTQTDLSDDTWVNLWLDGDGADLAGAADLLELLDAGASLCEARRNAEKLLKGDTAALDRSLPTSAKLPDAIDALENLTDDDATDVDVDEIADRLKGVHDTLTGDADRAYKSNDDAAGRLYSLANAIDDVLTPLHEVDIPGGEPLDEAVLDAAADLPVGGDLRLLLEDSARALRGEDVPEALLDAAVTALQGGRDGCRELAIYADDGYAHPDAWALLAGAIARDVPEVETETFAFDGDDGGRFKRLEKNDAAIVVDKNHHGALVVDTPAFTDITGNKCPLLGLDATGRPELWRLAIGRDTQRRDIHDSDAERRAFLRDTMNLTVVQTASDPLPYHGNPDGKNFNEDLELVKTVAEEYTGVGPDTLEDDDPAVISTLKVLNYLEDDLDEHASDLINYENMKGSDALGDRRVLVILGTQHYSDAVPEKWGVLAGEDAGRGDTRGAGLDYGSDVANAYLQYMREDYTMQAILRAGRNDQATVVFAHTSALRDDLPVDDEGAVLSAHSKGTLAVAEAAKQFTGEVFTANDVVEAIADDDRAVGRRQVQNVLADLRESGYLRVVQEGGPGVGYEYELDEDPGTADIDLPDAESADDSTPETYEKSANRKLHTWNFRSRDDEVGETGVTPPSRPTIPASEGLEECVADPTVS